MWNGPGITVVSHNSEGQRSPHKRCDKDLCSQMTINYNNIPIQQLTELADLSTRCYQYLSWRCTGSAIYNKDGTRVSGWYNRNGRFGTYWGGATRHSEKCACGMTNNCQRSPSDFSFKKYATGRCNCDNNDCYRRVDEGFLSYKEDLPVTGLVFGDIDQYGDKCREEVVYNLGKMKCEG